MSEQLDNEALLDSVSFAGMFSRKFPVGGDKLQTITKVVIPRIQRDYAQGRNTASVKRVRDRFLSAINKKLSADELLRLDFVYGDIDGAGIFTPFDGQQRLTTLFLLHWYSIQLLSKRTAEMANLLSRFSYETRPGARRFCAGLAKGDFDVKISLSVPISDQIRNCSRFVMSWNSDPTISGMLCMLDAINKVFAPMKDLWHKLVEQELVQFYVRPMSDMGLNDKLYIKMNARGKPLTNFEHFKAEFEREAEGCSEDLRKTIAIKFDTKWTDAFFDYRDRDGIVDNAFLNYFRFVTQLICWRDDIRYENFGEDEFKMVSLYSGRRDRYDFFSAMMDCWINTKADVVQDDFFSGWEHKDGKVSIFRDDIDLFGGLLCGDRGNTRERLLLFAITFYLRNKDKISDVEFRKRIRILRNLLFNSQDEIRPEKMSVIFDETHNLLAKGIIPTGKNGLNTNQKDDEKRKAKYLEMRPEARNGIERIEDLYQFRGGLSVLSESSYEHSDSLVSLFSYVNNQGWGLVQRALLTFCDYSQVLGRNRCFGSDDSRYLQELFQPSTQRTNFEGTKNALNQLVARIDPGNVEKSLTAIVEQYLKESTTYDWRYYFVKYSGTARGCYGKYLWWHRRRGYAFSPEYINDSPYEILFLFREQLNGQNWNWFLYVLSEQPEIKGHASLGNYAYNGDLLEVRRKRKITVDCLNKYFLITFPDGEQRRLQIPQEGGIDKVDRVQLAVSEITKIVM